MREWTLRNGADGASRWLREEYGEYTLRGDGGELLALLTPQQGEGAAKRALYGPHGEDDDDEPALFAVVICGPTEVARLPLEKAEEIQEWLSERGETSWLSLVRLPKRTRYRLERLGQRLCWEGACTEMCWVNVLDAVLDAVEEGRKDELPAPACVIPMYGTLVVDQSSPGVCARCPYQNE
jgi:hypothetical protein